MPSLVLEQGTLIFILFYFFKFYFIVHHDDSEIQSWKGPLRVFNACLILQMEGHEVW